MNKIMAVFEDRGAAQRAREDLLVSGFGAGEIDVIEQPAQELEGRKGPGLWDKIKDFFAPGERSFYEEAARRGNTLLAITASEGRLELAEDILERYGPADIDVMAAEWRRAGWTGEAETALPVVEETLRVGKRTVRGGRVRVHSRVTETPVEESVHLAEEHIGVERRPVDRPAGPEAFRETTIEAHETREEPVVQKEARVVEEVVLHRGVEEKTEKIKENLRKTEIDIEQFDPDFQQDFSRRFGSQGLALTYAEYRPAYLLGSELAMDPSLQGKDWSAVSSQAKVRMEAEHPGLWERMKDAVRYGYERGRLQSKGTENK